MSYRTNDGQALYAIDPEDIVRELHDLSYSPAENDREFMRQVGDRTVLQVGKRVRSYNANVFVADLIAVGLLVEE